jgi:predicted permease
MTTLFEHAANVVLPIALCVGVGYGLAWLKLPFDRQLIGKLVQTVGYPALIISHLSAGHVQLSSFLVMAAAASAMLAVFVVVASILLKLVGLPLRAFLAPMTLNNVGNIGLPVSALAFGDAGLSYAFAFLVVVLLGIFTYGTWVPRGRLSAGEALRSPVLYAIAIALGLLGFGVQLPAPLRSTFEILGGFAVPLMLLTLGHALATLTMSAFGRGLMLAVGHLAMAGATSFGLAALFGFTGTERGVFVLMGLMPASVATHLAVELYAPDYAGDVVGLIMASTWLTVLVLPLVLSYGV